MTTKNSTIRRNISWLETTDELAEKLAHERKMKVSNLLERLIEEEAIAGRIKGGHPSSLFQKMKDIALQAIEEAAKKSEGLGEKFEKPRKNKSSK